MEVTRHEGVVGRTKQALARCVGSPLRRVERFPLAIDFAWHPQLVHHCPRRVAVTRAQTTTAEDGAVPFHEGPRILVCAVPHDVVEALGYCARQLRLGFAQEELWQHGHAGLAVGANGLAVIQQRHWWIPRKDDPVSLRQGYVQEGMKRAI